MKETFIAFGFPAVTTVLGWIIFGSVGTIAVAYAKLKEEGLPATLGFALMFYPYLFPDGFPFWFFGVVLTAALFVPRRFFGL